jgi:hypothetical protein
MLKIYYTGHGIKGTGDWQGGLHRSKIIGKKEKEEF